MAAKPTLGYPTRSAAVLSLLSEGLTTRDIAARLSISTATVSALAISARRARDDGRRQKRPSEALARTVVITTDVLSALRPHAAKRDITVNALVRRLIETIADEGMVDAILDDGGDQS